MIKHIAIALFGTLVLSTPAFAGGDSAEQCSKHCQHLMKRLEANGLDTDIDVRPLPAGSVHLTNACWPIGYMRKRGLAKFAGSCHGITYICRRPATGDGPRECLYITEVEIKPVVERRETIIVPPRRATVEVERSQRRHVEVERDRERRCCRGGSRSRGIDRHCWGERSRGGKTSRFSLDHLRPNNHRWSMSVWGRGTINYGQVRCTSWR